jgi:microcystin-dependent protein
MTDSNLDIIRTQEDLINAVSVLYFNLMEIERIYYDMFINPTPMDVEFQRYDDAGVLERILLPNRAKDATPIATGDGNPNNKQVANPGALYLDVSSLNLYFKSSGTDNQGWVLLYSVANLDIEQFLKPNGDGSRLTNLNANNIASGTLAVERGGTGNNGTITGLVKANGMAAYAAAVDGVDYIGPLSMVGMVVYYPVNPNGKITGWLVCNGASYNPTDYPRLFNVIGYTYGEVTEGGIRKFKVPNFVGHYFKCVSGSSSSDFAQPIASHVGAHSHGVGTLAIGYENAHTHGVGSYSIKGSFPASESVYTESWKKKRPAYGCFYRIQDNVVSGYTQNDRFDQDYWGFEANKNKGWTGSSAAGTAHKHSISGNTANSSGDQETDVKHYNLVPIIKY